MIRSSTFGYDELYCAIQGSLGAFIFNKTQTKKVIKPLNAAIFTASFAFLEKVIHKIAANRLVPGTTAYFGPFPVGTKNLVS